MTGELWTHRLLITDQHLPERNFKKCVARHNGDSNFRGFSCWDQLLAMAFAQLTYRESLRDIESLLARSLKQAVSHGVSGQGVAIDFGRCERIS